MHFILIFFLIFSGCTQKSELNKVLEKELDGFNIEGPLKMLSYNSSTHTLFASSLKLDYVLKMRFIENSKNESTDSLIQKLIKIRIAGYESNVVPYPGQTTNANGCDQKYRPDLIQVNNEFFISSYSNSRLSPVLCQGEESTYRNLLGIYKFENKVVVVDVFIKEQSNIREVVSLLTKSLSRFEKVNIKKYFVKGN